MKTNELIPALALDDLLSMAASAIEDLLEHTDPNTSYYSGVWADVPGKLRAAAMLQAGNSPVIPEGYVMVPVEATEEMLIAGLEEADPLGSLIDWDASRGDCNTRKQVQEIFKAMLAAAPHDAPALNSLQSVDSVAGKWIPVSEQLPEECGRYWCYVEEQNSLGKSHYQWNCSWNGERWWVEGEDGGIVTHWMPLPAAPQEVK